MAELAKQIQQEVEELASVPKEPIRKFLGIHVRCHFCGQIFNPEQGTKVQGRNKCPKCGGANG